MESKLLCTVSVGPYNSGGAVGNRNKNEESKKWKCKKYHIDGKDWFTVQSAMNKHFLTAPKPNGAINPSCQCLPLYANYEIPSKYRILLCQSR